MAHDCGEGVLGVLDGPEVAGAESLGDVERGPAVAVLGVPDLDVGALCVEEADEEWGALVGGGVHDGLAPLVDVVEGGAELEEEFDGFEGFFFAGLFLAGGRDAHAGGGEEGAAVVGIGDVGIGAEFEEEFQEGEVGGVGGEEEGGGALGVEAGGAAAAICTAHVHVGFFGGHHFADEFEGADMAGELRGRDAVGAVAADALADPRDDVERSEAGPLVVGVGAEVDEVKGEFKVAVFDGEDQGRGVGPHVAAPRPIGGVDLVGVAPVLDEGLDDVLVRLANCCTPVPGDGIIGFVTRGRGVSVHRSDCANAVSLMAEQATRMIEVEWDGEERHGATFVAGVEVVALDRSRLLRDVTNALADHQVNILSCQTVTGSDRVAKMRFEFEFANPGYLDAVIRTIKGVDSVYDAYRLIPGAATPVA